MKKYYQFLLLSMAILTLTGCPSEPDSEVQYQLAIIKMTTEMQERVFVSPIVDSVVVDYVNPTTNLHTLYYGDGLVLCNPTGQDSIWSDFAQSQLKIVGTNPYIPLNNGYAIIDWKWANFQPLSGSFRNVLYSNPKIYNHKKAQMTYSTNSYYLNGFLANEEYYLLSLSWQDLGSLTTIWSMEQGQQIEKPEVRYINIHDIQKYGDLKKDDTDIYDINSAYWAYYNNSENFKSYIEERDKLQASYVEVLNRIIHNNDFEKWTITFK